MAFTPLFVFASDPSISRASFRGGNSFGGCGSGKERLSQRSFLVKSLHDFDREVVRTVQK
jgi:hypothetical protein